MYAQYNRQYCLYLHLHVYIYEFANKNEFAEFNGNSATIRLY